MQPFLDGPAEFVLLGLMHASSIGHVVILNQLIQRKPIDEEKQKQKLWRKRKRVMITAISLVLLAIFVLIVRIFASIFGICDSVIGLLDFHVIGIFALAEILFVIVFVDSYFRRTSE